MNQFTMKNKIVTLSAAVLLLSAAYTLPILADSNAPTFADLKDHWAKDAVAKAVAKKYVDGYGDGTFRPENYVTTAEFIKMVATATKLPVDGNTDGREWYVPYIKAAVEKGIVRDESITTDTINKPISRLEMSKIAVRATDPALQQKIVSINNQGAMYTAASKGLIQGLANGELAPEGNTTRGQSVTIIERILSVNNGEKLEVDKQALANAELAFKRTNIFSTIPVFGGKQLDGGTYKPYSPEQLLMNTPDGKYSGEIDQVVVVDMSNPNDPNRGLLGDTSSWRWHSGDPRIKEQPLVSDYPNSYIILIKGHLNFNKDEKLYGVYQPSISISGFKPASVDQITSKQLVTLRTVITGNSGIVAFILPKEGFSVDHAINITISAPAIPPQQNYLKNIVSVVTNE